MNVNGKPSYVTGGRVGIKARARAKAAAMTPGQKQEQRATKGPVQKPVTGMGFSKV